MSHSVAISLRIIVYRGKKSVPELNDQPTYVGGHGKFDARELVLF